ncbi:uncharacterized protein MYCFIDRAFT_176913 [Pseudocercospora fijiensis CIRAD86]|uniref:Uncharacterized protein n=1 Tax=Pseudocercospora fijiensis (strain CIRAD86) TaxID=383855 RepID=M3AR52_PSEFD|nr:uncharacterized protein MYCFIDRAFT_176913 [Pseudocercospora fijiensis CIRAD86]EME79912.1 hypothetical protein MYCFIDRAFT_176913 [Pseudocercospora fijiensis CIRAD86]
MVESKTFFFASSYLLNWNWSASQSCVVLTARDRKTSTSGGLSRTEHLDCMSRWVHHITSPAAVAAAAQDFVVYNHNRMDIFGTWKVGSGTSHCLESSLALGWKFAFFFALEVWKTDQQDQDQIKICDGDEMRWEVV